MPYPESCPECGSTFRNTGTHFTARRNEVGRHVLLELGCQNTTRRFWWDFTTGSPTEEGRPGIARRAPEPVGSRPSTNGVLHAERNGSYRVATNGHAPTATLELPNHLETMSSQSDVHHDVEPTSVPPEVLENLEPALTTPRSVREARLDLPAQAESEGRAEAPSVDALAVGGVLPQAVTEPEPQLVALLGPPQAAPASLKDAFVRQLQLDRLTLRQMRSWLMSDDARRAVEVAAGATEATYERLALILFGSELPNLVGKPAAAPQTSGMTAEDRLELQREKARIRARVRRAAAKSARQTD